jgi:hypothetical protein
VASLASRCRAKAGRVPPQGFRSRPSDEAGPPYYKFTFVQFVWNENSRSAWNPEEEGKQNSGEFQMPRFYFHKHLNGQTVRDRRGTSLRNENEAFAHAVRCTPLALRKSVSRVKDTYLAWEVSDGERTTCVVRGKVVIEKF